MANTLRGKVARILSSHEVAINIGAATGVETGMEFDVLSSLGEDIQDPDTGEILGSISPAKVRVHITKVEERLALASTESKQVNVYGDPGPMVGPFARSLLPQKWITKYEPLKRPGDGLGDADESDSYVKVGDPVVQVIQQPAA